MKLDSSAILNDIYSAIDVELKTVKRYGATSRITLLSGIKSSKEFSRTKLYRFEMLLQRNFPDGSQGKLILKGKSADAKVVMTEGQFIWLDVSEDFGERIPHSYFDVDLSFLLEDLKEKYSALIDGRTKMSRLGTNLLLANVPETPNYGFSVRMSIGYLSPEQLSAVEKIIPAEIGAIHGPPGTGKTQTLAGALVECFANEEKVLVCGYTNRAVDEALNKFKEAARKCIPKQFKAAYKAGRILRKGVSVFSEEEPIIPNPEDVVDKVKEFLQHEIDDVRRGIRDLQEDLKKLKKLDHFLEMRSRLRTEINNEEERYKDNDGKIGMLSKRIQKAKDELDAINKAGFLKRLYKTNRRRILEQQIRGLNTEKVSISSEQSKSLHRIGILKIELEKLEVGLKDLKDIENQLKVQNTIDPKAKIDAYNNELDRLKRKASDLELAIENAPETVLNNARIIFATLSRSHIDSDIYKTNFDRVFIDEASMAPLPQLFLTAFRAQKSVCIFGDPKQLAPICISNKDDVRKWFAKDIYQYAGLDNRSKNFVAELTVQRRMPQELGELVSNLFYQNRLEHDSKETKPIFPWMEGRKIALLNTTDQGAFCNRHEIGRGYSRLNAVHAVIALNILKEAKELGVAADQMAYITPYRAQAEFFGSLVLKNRDVLKTGFLEGLRWGTVHRFQGGEAELIIYDTCESPRQLPTRLTGGSDKLDKEDIEIDDSSRLHCVALSRAKSHLIILANLKWLRETLPESSKLYEIIKKISKLGSVIPVPEQHSALRLFSKDIHRGLFSMNLENSPYTLCDESNFYDLLEKDINACKKNVMIVSPYLGITRISLLESYFRLLNSKNVSTVIWTKDPSDFATRSEQHKELAKQLKQLGAEVLFRPGTHEKAVIIDETISYYGSLNPLSSISTKETMMRIKDKAFAKTLIDHLGISDQKTRQQEGFREAPRTARELILERLGLKKVEGKIDQEKVRKLLKKLRWIIAEDKGLPVQATLWNQTIDWLIEFRPKDIIQLYSCEEFKRNRTNIAGYENIVLYILSNIEN